MSSKHILVFAADSSVRRTKKLLLEALGFNVIAVGSLREIEFVTSRSGFDLLILSRTLSAEHKQQASVIFRQKIIGAPILEICEYKACVDDPTYVLVGSSPEDVAEKMREIFPDSRKRF
jgi:DNA-binding NtrC family response regulator